MKLAVLCAPDSWYYRDLHRAAAGNHELHAVPFSELAVELHGSEVALHSGATDLRCFDALLVRTMPPGSLEQVVFRMDALGCHEAAGQLVMNPPRAIEAAVDKFLASAKLHRAGLATPRTLVCQTVEQAMAAFERLGGDVVVKPLFGSEGRGIARVTDEAMALRAFKLLVQLGAVLYLQAFVPHEGADIRLLVVGNEIYAVRRHNPLDWRTNVSRGAVAEPFHAGEELIDLGRRAAAAVGASLAGVDVLPGRDGQHYVLEVNAVPGWKALARALDVDIAARVLDFLQRSLQGVLV